ncbi:MAG: hypothetical protein JSV33_15385 [bacterium]|nr:MAG: hypothetical protein JSV33_15385 [bacterium]
MGARQSYNTPSSRAISQEQAPVPVESHAPESVNCSPAQGVCRHPTCKHSTTRESIERSTYRECALRSSAFEGSRRATAGPRRWRRNWVNVS